MKTELQDIFKSKIEKEVKIGAWVREAALAFAEKRS